MIEKWSIEEEQAVDKFRKIMKDEVPKHMYEDKYIFYKFLKARNFYLQDAELMLRKHLVWRKEVQIDTIITDYKPPEAIKKYISQSFFGFSKEGYLLQYSAIGNHDGKGLLKSGNNSDVLRCIFQEIETNIKRMRCHSEKLGRPVNQCIYIYDLDKMTLAKATHKNSIEFFRYFLSLLQDNYPEILKDIYVINASIYFTIAFPIVKAILSRESLNKIQVYGKDGWKEELLRVIDADVLPSFLGGNRTDPDGNPLCYSFINHAGDIPVEYLLTKNVDFIKKKPGCKKLNIDRQKRDQVSVRVDKPGSRLHWEYETKHHDIGFGLELKTEDSKDAVELIPIHRMETENKSEEGFYTCKTPGTYVIIFDNTYSWLHSKEVYYRTWLTDPEDKDF